MAAQFIVLYITDACNLSCRHCFYYADLNKTNTIPFENLEKLSKSIKDVVTITFTGGEPFIRADLPEAVKLFHVNSGMSVASIPSNGILQRKILEDVETICSESPNLTVNITISLDGREKTHDYIRMKKDSFKKSKDTLKKLCVLKEKYKKLNVGVISTINEANQDEMKLLFNEINSEMDINQFQVNFIRGKTKELKPNPLTLRKYKELNEYVHEKLLNKEYKGYSIFFGNMYNAVIQRQKKIITETLEKDMCITQCYAGTANLIIFPDGQVSACEIRTDVGMGNLKYSDWNLSKLMMTKRAKHVKKSILASNCHCSFECQASSNIVYNPKQLALSLLDLIKMKMGLMQNYFKDSKPDRIE